MQRRLDVRDLEASQREAELQADITALSEQLDQKHLQSRDRRREESEQLTQLSNHNQKLVEQLAEVNNQNLCLFIKNMHPYNLTKSFQRHPAVTGENFLVT